MSQATSPQGSPTEAPAGSLWRNRNFLLLWCGQGADTLGPRVAPIVLPLLALDTLHAGTFQISLLTSLGWLPYLLFSLPAGILADRIDQRKLMIACDLGRLLLILSVPLTALSGRLTLWHLYTVVGVSGILTVAFTVAYRSQLPKLMHSAQLVDGNGKLGMCESLTELTGPGLGGVLAGAIGTSRALFVNVLTYALSALTLGLMRVPEVPAEDSAAPARVPLRAAMREGFAFVRREPVPLKLLMCTSVSNFFVTAANAIAVPFLVRELHAPTSAVGLVFTIGSVGGLLAGALATRAGLRPTLWICALGMWSAALFVVFSPLRSLRDVPVRRVATG
ncbi:MFS transporter [Streptomyces sp. NBC_01525]|uniref:MFS transporter n=1 Tax=Streptomyces sp. NBC_01525 TaxID=2903893 RepID=UPI00386C439B